MPKGLLLPQKIVQKKSVKNEDRGYTLSTQQVGELECEKGAFYLGLPNLR
jgi:hypothetical protein